MTVFIICRPFEFCLCERKLTHLKNETTYPTHISCTPRYQTIRCEHNLSAALWLSVLYAVVFVSQTRMLLLHSEDSILLYSIVIVANFQILQNISKTKGVFLWRIVAVFPSICSQKWQVETKCNENWSSKKNYAKKLYLNVTQASASSPMPSDDNIRYVKSHIRWEKATKCHHLSRTAGANVRQTLVEKLWKFLVNRWVWNKWKSLKHQYTRGGHRKQMFWKRHERSRLHQTGNKHCLNEKGAFGTIYHLLTMQLWVFPPHQDSLTPIHTWTHLTLMTTWWLGGCTTHMWP